MFRPLQTAAATAVLSLSLAAPMAAQAADAMRVVKDPVTGELRGPTAAEAAAFDKAEAQLRASRGQPAGKAPAPVEIRHPDGSVETKLGDDTMMYSVVTSGEDGALTLHCLPAKEAQKLVKSGKKSSVAKAASKSGASHE